MSGKGAISNAPQLFLIFAALLFVGEKLRQEISPNHTNDHVVEHPQADVMVELPSDDWSEHQHHPPANTDGDDEEKELSQLSIRGVEKTRRGGPLADRVGEFAFSCIPVVAIVGALIFASDVQRISEEIAEERRGEKVKAS